MVDPPKPSDASYQLFTEERKNIFDSLKRKAAIVSKKLNEIDGISTQTTDGAMYSFPLITLPQSVIIFGNCFFYPPTKKKYPKRGPLFSPNPIFHD